MKNMYKYALLFALAGGAALFTGCRADEEVDLAGYPETPGRRNDLRYYGPGGDFRGNLR